MSRLPLVSVIILNYKGGEVTKSCLRSVMKTRYPDFEIIVVDNGSGKKEVEQIDKLFGKRIRLILSQKNLGYAGGNNLGAQRARGKYLVFLNNDTIVPPDWLTAPIKRMEKDKKIAFLQPKIKWLKHKNFFEYAGGAGGYLDFFGYPFVRGRIFGTIEEDIGQYNDEREIFWASGVALFGRKNVFKKLGLFDPFLFNHAEEEDICFRAHRFGYKVIFSPESYIFHLGAYTDGRDIFKRTFYKYRNHMVLLFKNLKFRELIFILPVRLMMDIAAVLFHLVALKSPRSALAILLAYPSLARNLPKIFRQRYQYGIKNFGYPAKPGLVYKGSIILEYFLFKKKRWIEIFEKKTYPSELIKIF